MDKPKPETPDETELAQLETDFTNIFTELVSDGNLEKFKTEYQKLHDCLKRSHQSEKLLMSKCRELNAEIVSNSAKIATAMKFTNDEKETVEQLKNELASAWKMVDTAKNSESKAIDEVADLENEKKKLQKEIEERIASAGPGLRDLELERMKREQNELEMNSLRDEIDKMRANTETLNKDVKNMESKKDSADMRISELQNDLQVKINDLQTGFGIKVVRERTGTLYRDPP